MAAEPHVTFWELATAAAANEPNRVILADGYGRSLTCSQLRNWGERVAAGLAIGPGDVVSWQLPTSLEAAILMLALARVGAVQNPMITVLRHREVGAITAQVGASLLVVPEKWRGFSHGAMARQMGCRVLSLDFEHIPGQELRLPVGDPSELPPPPPRASECRWIYFSSGTTADPKGVRHSDATLIASSNGMTDLMGFGPEDVYPIAWPFSHIGGGAMLATSLRCGTKLVLFDAFDPGSTPHQMAAVGPTVLGSAPPFFRAYLDAQDRHGDVALFPRLRAFTAGGTPTPPEISRELAKVFGVSGVAQSWGLTEFPIATSAAPDDPPDVLANTVGRPAPSVTTRVVDGELRLKGPQAFLGYVDRTLDVDVFDNEGWVRTGDLGSIDANGNVMITGRLKDVIIRNAENISALEVEDVLLRHPGIADVAVVGLPDPRTGERVCAVIVPLQGATFDLTTVAAHCRSEGLAKPKWPEQVELVELIERNPMGKILKQNLRQRILASGLTG
jgi:acyl-CoA synthetase (AMP-forming)/AMP-acid ligase II